jgi:predicted nuclease of restriction endonuclease-like (RecB) superfamily
MDKPQIEIYIALLGEIKSRIKQAQLKATLSANTEMILMYWDIGKMIQTRQQLEGWSAAIIPKISLEIKNELPEIKGFSERNLGYMLAFVKEYPSFSILQQPVAKLESDDNLQIVPKVNINSDVLLSIPWGHHAILIQKIKDQFIRFWYMQQTITNGWSRDILALMIQSDLYSRQGQSVNNFERTLPNDQSDLVKQLIKDPYIFDFFTISDHFNERELETGLIKNLEKFLLELGAGFAFVGRQYHFTVGEKDFYIDLLFYHLKLRCFFVIDLKRGDFKPEHAGKVSFYCSVIDDILKHTTDQPSIGLILCQDKDKIIAEYALKNINQPIGVSAYELTRALPINFKSSLPSIEDLESELNGFE